MMMKKVIFEISSFQSIIRIKEVHLMRMVRFNLRENIIYIDWNTRLKDLIRHQIVSSLKNKSSWGYKIELNTPYNQTIQIGYFETKLDFGTSPMLWMTRFYIFKLYRKLGYSEKALLHIMKSLLEKYYSVNRIYIEFFETNRHIAIMLVKLGFKLCK